MNQGKFSVRISKSIVQCMVDVDSLHGLSQKFDFSQTMPLLMVSLDFSVHYESGCSGSQLKYFTLYHLGASS